MVGAYCRGKLLDQRHIGAPAGRTVPVTLKTEPGISGVYRITVYEVVVKGDEVQYLPRAERLTYRKNTEYLKVALDGLKDEYFPGDRVELKLRAQDETKKKTPAIGVVSVVDLSLFKLADDKTERVMPTHFLLTNEIRKPEDFENADVLLSAHPKAAQALDLLLGTQGWRRFAEQNPLENREPEASRVVTAWAQPKARRESADTELTVTAKVDKAYAGKAVKMLEQLAAKETVENGPLDAAQQLHIFQVNADTASRAHESAQAGLRDYERRMSQYLIGAFVIGALALGLGAIVLGVRRMGQGRSALASMVTGAALLLFLFMGSLAGVFYMIGKRDDPMLAWNKAEVKEAAANVAKAAPPAAVAAPMVEKEAPPPPAPLIEAPAGNEKGFGDKKADRPALPDMPLEQDGNNRDRFPAPDQNAGRGMPRPRMAPPQNPFPNQQMGGAALPGAQFAGQPGGPQMQQGGFGGLGNQGAVPNFLENQFRMDAPLGGRGGGGGNANLEMFEREMRRTGNYGEILRQRLQRNIDLPTPLQPLIVREYAHQHQQPLDPARGQ